MHCHDVHVGAAMRCIAAGSARVIPVEMAKLTAAVTFNGI